MKQTKTNVSTSGKQNRIKGSPSITKEGEDYLFFDPIFPWGIKNGKQKIRGQTVNSPRVFHRPADVQIAVESDKAQVQLNNKL